MSWRVANRCLDSSSWDGSHELLCRWSLCRRMSCVPVDCWRCRGRCRRCGRRCCCCLRRCATKLGLQLGDQVWREGAASLPYGDHVRKLRFLVFRDGSHDVVEQHGHEFSDALHSSRVRAHLTATLDVQILSVLLRGVYPLPYYAVDHIQCAEFMRCWCLLECAIEYLHDCGFCLRRRWLVSSHRRMRHFESRAACRPLQFGALLDWRTYLDVADADLRDGGDFVFACSRWLQLVQRREETVKVIHVWSCHSEAY